jgi:hypothetical protein
MGTTPFATPWKRHRTEVVLDKVDQQSLSASPRELAPGYVPVASDDASSVFGSMARSDAKHAPGEPSFGNFVDRHGRMRREAAMNRLIVAAAALALAAGTAQAQSRSSTVPPGSAPVRPNTTATPHNNR